ncbi:MAG: amidohydrolase [Lachnospiraceae bacterium]|nr:amidohydrolase [Lachnospiraceae bacterium]
MIKQDVYDEVLRLEPLCRKTARWLWKHPELSRCEKESANYMRKLLLKEGFTIVNSQRLPHAFYAEYGKGSPVIAVLGEYDALPELSQDAVPERCPTEAGAPGHGCGHNLLGAAAATGAIAIRRILEKSDIPGTIRFYGCPQEELLDGKVYMIKEGMFDGCDAALSWHPMDATMTHDRAYLASTTMKFYFRGISSHAAFAPERGRSALDAVELMSVGCNYLREHVVDKTRIHYTTDSGGFAPNIVPDKASAWYYVRAPYISDVKDTATRVEHVAEGAAMMTDTTVKVEHGSCCCEFKENNAFADLTYANLIEADGPKFTAEEIKFAEALQKTIADGIVADSRKAYGMDNASVFMGVGNRELCEKNMMTASSDTGDVSYYIPTGLFTVACWPIGCAPHTWQATASAGSTLGEKGSVYAAKVIAGTAWDLLTQPEALNKIVKEFASRNDGTYQPLTGDQEDRTR